ncbi:MAG: tryptophan--tRNA ligase [Patescibacteria group bacterium]
MTIKEKRKNKNAKFVKPALISGIQPTGKLHIGNYVGALKNFANLQNSGKYDCYFFVADLHSLTEEFDPGQKPAQILDVVLNYLALGLDPKKSTVFIQSQAPAHSELCWILNTIAPFGELGRMIQFKEKSESQKQNINVGLFDYPVLQAADILLYKAEFVPVGEDQLQHLEFARTLARKFNAKFGKIFREPKPVLAETPRLMSLDDPAKKMSKSRPAGCLFIDDSPETIREKIKKATTDSGSEIKYDFGNKPAISNLMKIYSAFSGRSPENIEKRFKNKSYGDFKKELAEIIIADLAPFQEKKKGLERQSGKITAILKNGAQKANRVSQSTMTEVKKAVGLI